jgi:hypothetical protein
MRTITRLLPASLAVFVVLAPVSASACDLSCWLNLAQSDCHSAGSAADETHGMMPEHSNMDMDSVAGSHPIQSNENPRHALTGVAHHSMPVRMGMVRSSLQAAGESGANSSAAPRCTQETCSLESGSASPPSSRRFQPPYLHCVVIHVSNPALFSKSFYPKGSSTAPPISLAASVLSILRI